MKKALNILPTGIKISFNKQVSNNLKVDLKSGLISVESEKYNDDFNYQKPIKCQKLNIQKPTKKKKIISKFQSYPMVNFPLSFYSRMVS